MAVKNIVAHEKIPMRGLVSAKTTSSEAHQTLPSPRWLMLAIFPVKKETLGLNLKLRSKQESTPFRLLCINITYSDYGHAAGLATVVRMHMRTAQTSFAAQLGAAHRTSAGVKVWALLTPRMRSMTRGPQKEIFLPSAHYNHGGFFQRTWGGLGRLMGYMKSSNPESSLITHISSPESAEKILITGIHLDITPALRAAALKKAARLLRHQTQLVRIRIDIELVNAERARFVAKGHIEISGPDIVAHVASDDAYKSLDLLVDRLDRMLRERTRTLADRRNNRPEGTEFRDRLAQASQSPATDGCDYTETNGVAPDKT
jgi:putative sigma-54 modulation protein